MNEIKLYRHPLSGHCHRVELLLSLMGLEVQLIDVDLLAGAHKQPEFLAKNPVGQVPVLEDGDVVLSDSNAILVYLATRHDVQRQWLPQSALASAEVQKFLTVAAGPVAFGPAAARLVTVFGAGLNHEAAKTVAAQILAQLNQHLRGRRWLVGDAPTIADVANYAYIAHAPEGEVALVNYPEVRAWLERIESLPGFVPMQATSVGLAA